MVLKNKTSANFNFIKGSSYMISSESIYFISGYFIHIVAANKVSALDYGRFGIVMSLMGLIYVFLSSGLPQSLTKYVSEGFDAKLTYSIVLKYQLTMSLFLSLALFFTSSKIANILGDANLEGYIRVVCVLIPLRAFFHINRGLLNGLSQFGYSSTITVINNLGKAILSIVFLLMGYGIFSMLGSYIAATFFAIIVSIRYISKIDFPEPRKKNYPGILFFSFPLVIFTMCYTIMDSLDIFFIKVLFSDPNASGYYNASKVITSTLFSIGLAVSYTALPTVSRLYSSNDVSGVGQFVSATMKYLIIILIPLTIYLFLNSSEILEIFFPQEYTKASDSLKILSISTSFFAILIVQSAIINGIGKPLLPMITGIFLVVLLILLNLYLIPIYGMVGSPMATLICTFIGTLIFSSYLFYRYRNFMDMKNLRLIISTNTILFLLIYNVKSLFFMSNIVLVIFLLFTALIYIFCFYFFDFKDISTFYRKTNLHK